MADITETKDLVRFIASLGEAIYESVKDGKVSWTDYRHFFPVLGDLLPALSGIERVPDELDDLTDEEIQELVSMFCAEFELDNAKAEELVEEAIDTGVHLFSLVTLIMDLKDKE